MITLLIFLTDFHGGCRLKEQNGGFKRCNECQMIYHHFSIQNQSSAILQYNVIEVRDSQNNHIQIIAEIYVFLLFKIFKAAVMKLWGKHISDFALQK